MTQLTAAWGATPQVSIEVYTKRLQVMHSLPADIGVSRTPIYKVMATIYLDDCYVSPRSWSGGVTYVAWEGVPNDALFPINEAAKVRVAEWQLSMERAAKPAVAERSFDMNNSLAVFLINPNVRAILATYEAGATPELFKTFDQTIQKDDLVVVPTNTRHLMTVVKVTEVDVDFDIESNRPANWVVCRIDQTEYESTLKMESAAIAKIKSAELRQKREQLATALFKDKSADLMALPISKVGVDTRNTDR
jgi:hypothetical protein